MYSVSLNTETCSCGTFTKPCKHLLAVCLHCVTQPDLEKIVHKRWYKSYQLDFLASSHQEPQLPGTNHQEPQINSESICENVDVLSMAGLCFEKMNRNQRYNYASRTLKSLCDNLADCAPKVFAARLSHLQELIASWLRGEELENDPVDGANCAPKIPSPDNRADTCCRRYKHSRNEPTVIRSTTP